MAHRTAGRSRPASRITYGAPMQVCLAGSKLSLISRITVILLTPNRATASCRFIRRVPLVPRRGTLQSDGHYGRSLCAVDSTYGLLRYESQADLEWRRCSCPAPNVRDRGSTGQFQHWFSIDSPQRDSSLLQAWYGRLLSNAV